MTEEKKRGFRIPSSYTVLFIIIAIMAVLTWFIPAGAYETAKDGGVISGTYKTVASNPQGFFDILMAPVRGMLGVEGTDGAIQVSFFILMVGGFLGVVNKTGALDTGIASVVRKNKGREKMLIAILIPLFALGGSTYGMGEETMAFYPLLIPVMIAVGFDSIVAVAIILIGSQIGCLASTINPFATGVAADAAGVSIADGMIWRIIQWFILVGMSIWFVYNYASKIEKDPSKSLVADKAEEHKEFFQLQNSGEELNKRQRNVLTIFTLTFVIMILSLIPWEDFGIKLFTNINTWLTTMPILGGAIGKTMGAFGTWYFPEITMLFIMMGVLVAIVYRMSEDDFLSSFLTGAGEFLGVAIICAIARGIQVIMNGGMITATILHWGETGLSGLSSQVFIILAYIFYLPMSFLIPSTSGLAGATMGIMAPLGQFSNVPAHLVITAFQSASGILNMISPTSAIVMGALALGRVDLGTWWKFIGKFIVMVMLVSVLLLVVATFF
ncbi:YfcC family protein [Streptococcus dysgalactiae subsp. equisimilis]|uniref:YfcC family protein n=1 Tax=Streptococcus dysgalactiae TaxID=1334 RepID=UPI000617DC2F|nr:YfcC family protein [Streptococcus dysgalactiae]KKC18622.1 arginine:ornithine antiporter [Streptococcus dysgalactiae subsp. equisimilis]OBZ01182.1 arginine:ornithine antiporter [Streptococcus dysgalactiae subsp. equisimilis]OBZ02273.1 arginine:ornithine antiporter [Streptococcus dysgalactiae subsp. equisimilis]OCX01772.1 arginine:ornithine antiporter [Streptococcus dysgalactiae subsp. equisimilis]SLM21918.1 arginine:ornithine antiporter [Streptococcus dysgalactiae subsp. equisimilis]